MISSWLVPSITTLIEKEMGSYKRVADEFCFSGPLPLATIAETPTSTDRMARGAILGDHGVRGGMGGIYAFNVLTLPWDIPDRAPW